jgi:plasmid stability protein
MAGTITIRNLDDKVQRTLKHRAVDHGVSFEAELRAILEAAARQADTAPTGAQVILAASQKFREATEDLGDWELERVVEYPRGVFE